MARGMITKVAGLTVPQDLSRRVHCVDHAAATTAPGRALSVIWRDALPVGRGRILTHIVARRRRDAAFLAASKTPDSEKSQAVGARVAARFKRHAGITDKLRGDSIHMGKGPIPIIPHEAVGGAAWIIPWTPSQVTVLRGAIRRPRTNLAAVAGHYKVKCITARI